MTPMTEMAKNMAMKKKSVFFYSIKCYSDYWEEVREHGKV